MYWTRARRKFMYSYFFFWWCNATLTQTHRPQRERKRRKKTFGIQHGHNGACMCVCVCVLAGHTLTHWQEDNWRDGAAPRHTLLYSIRPVSFCFTSQTERKTVNNSCFVVVVVPCFVASFRQHFVAFQFSNSVSVRYYSSLCECTDAHVQTPYCPLRVIRREEKEEEEKRNTHHKHILTQNCLLFVFVFFFKFQLITVHCESNFLVHSTRSKQKTNHLFSFFLVKMIAKNIFVLN